MKIFSKIYLAKRFYSNMGNGPTFHNDKMLLEYKKWLRNFITLGIRHKEIRSFLGILVNCTSLFFMSKAFVVGAIISPIYSDAMYVSNGWMRHSVACQNG